MSEPPIAYVDCETLGLEPDRHRVWEVAVIRGEEETVVQIEVDVSAASEGALFVNDYYRRDRRGALPEGEAARRIAVATSGAILAGCNVQFDAEMLRALLRRNSLVPGWYYHLLEVTDHAAGFLGLVGGANTSVIMKALWPNMIVIDPEERHTALGDARLAKRIHEEVLHRHERLGDAIFSSIMRMAEKPPEHFSAEMAEMASTILCEVNSLLADKIERDVFGDQHKITMERFKSERQGAAADATGIFMPAAPRRKREPEEM